MRGQSFPGKETQCKGVEATYAEPSVCYCTGVLRTKTVSQTKLFQSCPHFSLFHQIHLISRRCLRGHNSCFSSSHGYLLSYACLERNEERNGSPTENMGIKLVIVEVITEEKKKRRDFFFFPEALAPFWFFQSLPIALHFSILK